MTTADVVRQRSGNKFGIQLGVLSLSEAVTWGCITFNLIDGITFDI